MGNAFQVGVNYLKKEGIIRTIIRFVKWVPEYLAHERKMIRIWFFDIYRGWIRFRKLKMEGSVDCCIKFRKVWGGIEYCKKNGQEYEILNQGEQIEVVLPQCFEGTKNEDKTQYDAPAIYITMFNDVEIYSGTQLISLEKDIISDILYRDKENRYNLETGCLVCHHRKGKYLMMAFKETDVILQEAITLVGWGSANYYHFTFEILSRLVFIDRYEEYRSIPVLIDANTLDVPQMRSLLDKINIYQHPVIPVEQFSRVHVKKLIFISANMWVPFNFKKGVATRKEDFLISHSVANNIRERVLPINRKTEKAYKKIFLSRRKKSVQRLVNTDEIEKLFHDNGYHIIYPEELAFNEQVEIFHNADIIVGVGGAAFVNIIYCHERAKVGVIAPETHSTYSHSNIANIINIKFIKLEGKIVLKNNYESLDTFLLDKDKCLRFIKFMEKEF